MITENLSTLKIHKLTQDQYDRELLAGNIDENALYLTPDEENSQSTKDIFETKEVSGTTIAVDDSAKAPIASLKLYGKTTQDGTPTPDTPVPLVSVGDSGSYSVDLYGKNLIDVKDKPTDTILNTDFAIPLKKGTTLTHSILVNGGTLGGIRNGSGYTVCAVWGRYDRQEYELISVGTTLEHDCHSIKVIFSSVLFAQLGGTATSYSIQVEVGTEVTPYEPYNKQSMTFTDTLRGVGDIKDVKDFARGVTTKRFDIVDLGTLNWVLGKNKDVFYAVFPQMKRLGVGVCEKYPIIQDNLSRDKVIYHAFSYDPNALNIRDTSYTDAATLKADLSGTMLVYELAEPIETPIPEEELNAYRQLHTNKPNTTFISEADMEVDYVVDSTSAEYIENRLEEVEDTIPTKTSQLTNDSGFKTTDNNTTYTLTQDATDGHKITLTPSSGTPTTITIPDNNTTYSVATQSANGLMSTTDKTKLDGIATGANKTTVDSALSSTSTNPVQNKIINSALANKVDKVDGKGLSTNDYTTTEKNKLAGIATGANAYSHPTTSGNKHIPSGGSSGQILRWSADGTATWGVDKTPINDTRSTNQTPEWYWTNYPCQVVREFKYASTLGVSSGEIYCCLETIVPWTDASGGYPKQIVTTNVAQLIRTGTSATKWGTWSFVLNAYNDVGLAPGKAIDFYHESQGKVRAVDMTEGGHLRFGIGTHPTIGGNSVTELVGGTIHFWAAQSTEALKPYYAAGDTFELNGITSAMIYIEPKVLEFTIPLAKPIIGEPTISATAKSGMLVKREGKWLYGGSESSPFGASINRIAVRKYDNESIYIVVYFNNSTNASANSECAANYSFYITLS